MLSGGLRPGLGMVLALGLVWSCTSSGVPADNAQVDEVSRVTGAGAPAVAEEEAREEKPAPDPVAELLKTAKLRYPLTRFTHFAEVSHAGSVRVDLGSVGARKYINGGWRTGWSSTVRGERERYLEASSKTARFFFHQEQGGFDRLVLRMKAPKKSNRVGVYLNDQGLGELEIGAEFADYTVEVPEAYTRAGENQLMLRFKSRAKVDGRRQTANVASIAVLRSGVPPESLPTAIKTRQVQMGDEIRDVVVSERPETMTWRVQVPAPEPRMVLTYGAASAGAGLKVEIKADGGDRQVVFEGMVEASGAGAWHGHVLPLDAWVGEVVEVSVTSTGDFDGKQLLGWDGGIYTAPYEDGATPAEDPTTPSKNVLVYLVDTLRRDKLGVYNNKTSVQTPHLDAFARDATLFEAAYVSENWTKPSTATILTGLYPDTHQTKDASSKLPVEATMLSEHLRKKGFRTGSFIANGYVSTKFGFNKGWHHYTNYIREYKNTNAEKLVDDALKFIDRNNEKRWFVYMHTIDPHVPYSAPGAWKFKHWHQGKYRGPIKAQSTGNQLGEVKSGTLKLNKSDKTYLEALYDGEVAYNDSEFGRLVKALKARGVYDETVIVVLVDHGEEFWDHGSVGHGHSLYGEMVHGPMFVRYPNMFPRGRRLPHVVSTVGVVPTVLETLGVEPMAGIDGVSFTDVFDGIGDPRPRVATSDFMYRRKALRAGRYHWQTNGIGGELYDTLRDVREEKNLMTSHPIARAYVRGLFGMFMGASDKTRWWMDLSDASRRTIERDVAEIDPELREQLEAMGYIEGATSEHSPEEDRKLMKKEDEE